MKVCEVFDCFKSLFQSPVDSKLSVNDDHIVLKQGGTKNIATSRTPFIMLLLQYHEPFSKMTY